MANREFNDVKINVEFQETTNRQQISSGDEIKTLFGKIKKWFSDLKTVAFTGRYKDLLDKPYLPSKRNFKQETYLFNSTGGKRYVKIAQISPINNINSSMVGITLKLINGDYQMCSLATVHFGFASWNGSNYVDWGDFETIDGWDKNTAIANSPTGSKSLKNMLILVHDPVDYFCFELWVKLETYCSLYIGLDHYMEVYTTGAQPNVTIYGYGNESEYNFQPVSFLSGNDLVYLDHIPTPSDGYGNEDYPEAVFGNWT